MADGVVFIETKNGQENDRTHSHRFLNHVKRRNVAVFFLFHPKTKGRIAWGTYDSYSGLLSLENAIKSKMVRSDVIELKGAVS